MDWDELEEAYKIVAQWRLVNTLTVDGITQQMLDDAAASWRESGASDPNFMDVVASLETHAKCTLLLMCRAARLTDVDVWEDLQDYVESIDTQVLERMGQHFETLYPKEKDSVSDEYRRLATDRDTRKKAYIDSDPGRIVRDVDILNLFNDPLNAAVLAKAGKSTENLTVAELNEVGHDLKMASAETDRAARRIDIYLSASCASSEAERQALIAQGELTDDLWTAFDFHSRRLEKLAAAMSRNPEWVRKAVREEIEDYIMGNIRDECPLRYLKYHADPLAIVYGAEPADRFVKAIGYEEHRRLNAHRLRTSIRPYTDRTIVLKLERKPLPPPWRFGFDRDLDETECDMIVEMALGKPEIPKDIAPKRWARILARLVSMRIIEPPNR